MALKTVKILPKGYKVVINEFGCKTWGLARGSTGVALGEITNSHNKFIIYEPDGSIRYYAFYLTDNEFYPAVVKKPEEWL